jgi:hypothetical protein
MLEEVLSYRLTVKAQMKRVFLALYPNRQDFIRCREAKAAIRDLLGFDNTYFYGRMLTEVMREIRYRKVHYAGRLFYRPKFRSDRTRKGNYRGKARQDQRAVEQY